jgi:hypothetical protein
MGNRKWNSVNNIGVYSDGGPRRFRTQKSEVENGVVNGDANHEGEEEVPHVEAPIDNEEAENGTGEEAPASEEAGAAEDGDAPATEEEAAVAEETPATEEEGASVEEPPASDEESPAVDEVEALVEEAAATEEETPVVEEETPAAEETPEAAEEAPAEEEVAGADDDVAAAVEEQAPPEELSTVAEEEETTAEAEEAAVTEVESAPAEEVPVSDETPAVDEEAVVVEEAPAEEALAAEEEAGEVEEAPAPEAEEEIVVPEEGVELTDVPGELRTASGMAVATDGRHIEKLSDQLARTYIRGRPITMRIPPESRESWNPEDPLEKPPLEFQLEWVYGYRGQIDGHGNPNLYYLPTGEIVYYVAAVVVLYNLESHTQRHYTGHTNDIHCIAVHPGGPYVATGQAEGHSKISSTVQQSHVQV